MKTAAIKGRLQRWVRAGVITSLMTAILIALIMILSCGIKTQDVIEKAYATTESLQSYRMFGSKTSTVDLETSVFTFEAEFSAPDNYHGKIDADWDSIEFIIIGDKEYIRDSDLSQTMSIGVLSDSFLSKRFTLGIIDALVDFEKLPDETIDQVTYLHYRGRVDIDRMINKWKVELDPAQPEYDELAMGIEQFRNIKMEIELLIDRSDYFIRQIKEDTLGPSQSISNATWNLYDFNKPIEIKPPEAISGELLPGWRVMQSPSGTEPEQPSYPSKTPNNPIPSSSNTTSS